MSTFRIKENDTSPAILFALTPTSVNLNGAAALFRMRPIGSTAWAITESADIQIATVTPTLRYDWDATDTATPGFYEAEFVVTYSDNTVETFPNSGFITINIVGDETGLSANINNVRFLIGDTDADDYAITNDNIAFALSQAGNDLYLAGAICARALAGKYATFVDTKFETVSSNYSQLRDNYYALATKLEAQSKKYGSRGLGLPDAGGLTYSGIRANDLNDDRVQPKFKQDQFANPPRGYEGEKYGY
jgi:hypothetical protein